MGDGLGVRVKVSKHYFEPCWAIPSDILICMVIKAIIFDLGGVLLRTADFTPREKLAERLNMNRHELEEFIFGGDSGDKAQRGMISAQQHWVNLRDKLGYTQQEFKLVLDEFFSLDELDEDLVDYVRGLHKTYKTALLSNAWDDSRQLISEKWHIEDAFDTLIISAEVGTAKPDQSIFMLALDRLAVKANEAIFVDDFQRNVEAAIAVGLHGIRFQTAQQVQDDVELLLNGR
jgi:epoxide hydrolase-like predicted phosphatase